MMLRHAIPAAGVITGVLAAPAAAAVEGKPFFSLYNTDIVVAIAFVIFVGILAYFGVHKYILAWLDKRADGIRNDLDEARKLREEAQSLLASYERQHKEVQGQADRIVARAKEEAAQSAREAKADLERSVARRMQAAQEQIAAAERAAIREVRNQAATIATAAARDVIAERMSAEQANKRIDTSIDEVEKRLH